MFDSEYHLSKANVVTDALSRKNQGIVASIVLENWKNMICNFVKRAIERMFAR